MINKNENLEKSIEDKRNNIKGDRLDMSFGEIINLYRDQELIITPEYQRAFRWEGYQKTGFIESILLGIPVPPIFVAEDVEGKWELVDGLQRISTILSFFGQLKTQEKNELKLEKGDIISELEGIDKDNIPLKLSNIIKRAICRVEILRWDSSIDMRYELFNRLNTTSSPLTYQEIRNCIFRNDGNEFNQLLKDIAISHKFKEVVSLTKKQEVEMFGEELILRFFCFQHNYEIKNSLHQNLTQFMKQVTKKNIEFNLDEKRKAFTQILDLSKRDYFRASSQFSIRYWDSILYYLSQKVEKNKSLKEEDIEKIKQDIDNENINKSYARKERPKIAIEIAKKVLKNG